MHILRVRITWLRPSTGDHRNLLRRNAIGRAGSESPPRAGLATVPMELLHLTSEEAENAEESETAEDAPPRNRRGRRPRPPTE